MKELPKDYFLPRLPNDRETVKEFFRDLVAVLGNGFHPDTPFEDYVIIDHRRRTKGKEYKASFSARQARQLNKHMEACFATAAKEEFDIYEVALECIKDEERFQEWRVKKRIITDPTAIDEIYSGLHACIKRAGT